MRGKVVQFRASFLHQQHAGVRDAVTVEIERAIPADQRWNAVRVNQYYASGHSFGEGNVASFTLRFVNQSLELIEAHDPSRLLAFRGPVEVSIQTIPDSFGIVIVALTYHYHWSGMEQLLADIDLDARVIEAWLESEPVSKPEGVATT